MTKTVNWGIIGTGSIAKAFAYGLKSSKTGTLVAVGSRTQASADAFGDAWEIPVRYGSYAALLEDRQVDAVYVATPHPMHAEWAIKAAEAGKHVLCEKPAALNQWQAAAMIEAARANGVAFMEAFMYRCHPQITKLRELLQEGAIGEVRMIEAAFAFGGGTTPNPANRTENRTLGGGGILDVGGYAVSMARLIAGEALGRRFAEPLEVKAVGHIGETTGVDEWTAALLKFEGDIVAQVATGVRVGMRNDVMIYGSGGRIQVPDPWVPKGREGVGPTEIHLKRNGRPAETIQCTSEVTLYGLEADAMAAALPSLETPEMPWADSLGNMAVLDAWRAQIGLLYDEELPNPVSVNLANRPVKPLEGHRMRYADVPGLEKPVSKLIFGALTSHGSYAKAQVMFDKWVELGGNTFDTGQCYGRCDEIFGQWLASRGIRDELIVIAKGNHPPHDRPECVAAQMEKMLNEMRTDWVDIWIMHRDNPDYPVSEWIDALNAQIDKGRIKVLGGSNWTRERFAEANAWAQANGRQGLTILNNNLALAHMVKPVWGGCLHVSDRESRAWLSANDVVHFSWSSTARGFFTERSGPDKLGDRSLAECWYSERNFQVKARAEQLAREMGCAPINIAAAWVLNQPFRSFALIGPETPTEMAQNLPSLEIELTPEQITWLAMEA